MNPGQFARERSKIERARGRSGRWRKRAMQHLQQEAGAKPIHAGGKLLGHALPSGKMVCVKIRYRTANEAAEDLARIRHLPGDHTKPARWYPCPLCRGFHLTSKG